MIFKQSGIKQIINIIITFNIVDSVPDIGITFEYTSEKCGYNLEPNINPADNRIHVGLRVVYLGEAGECGTYPVNNAIHEIFHCLGFFGHTTVKNTVMTTGGTWVGSIAGEGEIDQFTITIIRQLYDIPPGTHANELVPE